MNYGPSKTRLVVRKQFAPNDTDRLHKEGQKLCILKNIGESSKLFKVPEVVYVGSDFYELEYIPNAKNLSECGFLYSPKDLQDKLFAIMDNIAAYEPSSGDVWDAMLAKFKQLKALDPEYDELVARLPTNLVFPNQDGYSHGDLSFDNIMYANGDLYLIDPAWSAIESPLWDVGKILQSVLINWQGIKDKGRALQDDRPGWMTALCYNVKGGAMLDDLMKKYSYDGVLLATACQLSRVARWCFPEVLIPIIKKLLHIYFNDSGVGPDGNTDALRRII